MAKVKTKVKFAGGGAFIQLLGVVAIVLGAFLGVIGIVLGAAVGITLLLVGSSMSKYSCCSECGNRVDGRHVKICPICHVRFGESVAVAEAALPSPNGWRDAALFIGGAVALCGALFAYRLWV